MAMTFNQFQRELKRRGIDTHLAIILTELYSQQRELGRQMNQLAEIIDQVVGTVGQFAELHEATQGKVMELKRDIAGDVEGVSIETEDTKTEH